MLPAKNRLPLKFNKPKFASRIGNNYFSLFFTKRESGQIKAAITVSKKIAPKAVDRNRIKRLISESLSDKRAISADLLVKVNTNVSNWKKGQVAKSLDNLIEKIK